MYDFKNSIYKNNTNGNYENEKDAQNAIIDFLQATGLFYIFQQIEGIPLKLCHFKNYQRFRADVLVLPSEKLIELGWDDGAIIFEIKRSGVKIGPAINQLWDYLNSSWEIVGGVAVVPTYGFVFSAPDQFEAVASIMAQNHIGTAQMVDGQLHLYCGHSLVMRIRQDGIIDRMGKHNFGKRIGSR
ncbi:MAG: hypothetical protein A2Y12_07000 [Planctomycetes bacterium GWF2_42_9]|nr:MAG: hypothetical protein A2Y12_07000 [Planctomycetes bacterium GWF2_42_9]